MRSILMNLCDATVLTKLRNLRIKPMFADWRGS